MKRTSPSRGRTLAHMHQMLAATAAVGCSRADVQTVTLTPLPTVPASTDTTSPPPLPPTASATAPDPPPQPPPDPSGYLVVDMLPAPARCLGLAAAAKASARFTRAGGDVVLDVTVTLPGTGKLAGTTFHGTVTAWSSTVVSSSFRHGTVAVARVKPAAGATQLGVTFGVSCGAAGVGMLGVTVSFPAGATPGAGTSLTLQDY